MIVRERTGKDYAFYEGGQDARRSKWLVVPVRRLLRRLLGPVWERELALFEAMDADLVQVDRSLASQREEIEELKQVLRELSEQLEAVDQRLHSTAALVGDQVALARRLGSLEDYLAAQEPAESQTQESG